MLAFLLLLVLGFGCLAALAPARLSSAAQAAPAAQLQGKLQGAQDRLQQARAGIRQAEELRREALSDIGVLDQQIDALEVELGTLDRRMDKETVALRQAQRKLTSLTADVEKKRAQLVKAQADLVRQQAVMNDRAADLYKNGRLSYVEMVFQSERLTELLNRLDLLGLVAQQDADLLGQIETARSRVETEKSALEKQQAAVAAVEQEQRERTDGLRQVLSRRQAARDQLAGARSRKQQVVHKAERDKASWERQEDSLLAESSSIASQLQKLAPAAARPASAGGFVRPVGGRVSSSFGYRVHPIFGVRKLHTGVDLAAGAGTPIVASATGRVVFAGWRGGYGRTVIVDHGGGVTTLYAHQSSLSVSQGQSVTRGQQVGRVGSTGYSTGPHLHFEVRVNGSPVDPMRYV